MFGRISARLRDESGIALVFALLTMAALTASVGTVVYVTSQSGHQAQSSRIDDQAFQYAEAALNTALSIVTNKSNDATDSTLLPCASSGGTPVAVTYAQGSATYQGCLTDDGSTDVYWTISATGKVANPNVVGGYRLRTVGAKVTVNIPPNTQTYDNTSQAMGWYIARGTGQTCDQTIGTKVEVPLFVSGNLCYTYTSSSVYGLFQGDTNSSSTLQVRGGISAANSGSVGSGSSLSTVYNLDAGSGCKLTGATSWGSCNSTNRAYPRSGTTTNAPITLPSYGADFAHYYSAAAPGPNHPCIASKSSGPYPTFESAGNSARDNSAGASNLTPSSSYTCYVNRNGSIAWNASTKTLTVHGVIYIDGSAYVSNGAANKISGFGTLYLSGSFLMSNNSKLCYYVSNGNCASTWFMWWFGNLYVVADGNGTSLTTPAVPAGDSIFFSGADQFQGWAWTTNTIEFGSGTQVQAPMNARNFIFDGDFIMNSWSAPNWGPPGAPGEAQVDNSSNTATDFSG